MHRHPHTKTTFAQNPTVSVRLLSLSATHEVTSSTLPVLCAPVPAGVKSTRPAARSSDLKWTP